jgi:tol-pal system protein YbgF
VAGVLVVAGFALAPLPVQAQQGVPAGNDQIVNVVAQQQVRIGELERLVQDLTGRVEEAQFRNRQLGQRLEQLMKDMEFRFQQLEGNGDAAAAGQDAPSAAPQQAAAPAAANAAAASKPGTTPPGVLGYMGSGPGSVGSTAAAPAAPAKAATATAALPPGTAEEQYNYSFGLLRKNDFTGAEAAFKTFLEQHKDHALAGNAQYWLGETYYARGDFKQAMVAFYDGYRTYPKSSKAPDNLLKLGMTAAQLGQAKQACAAFAKMAVEYPSASDMLKRRAQTERQRQNCP